jgi:5-methylcytosine-specific restriction endonuclease McrA
MPSRPKIFRPGGARSSAQLAHDYEARRGTSRERGYTAGWDRSSLAFKRLHPLCLGCEAVGLVTATTVTDHTEPHKGDPVKFWDREKWQPACDWHHDVVKQVLEKQFAAGRLTVADLRLNSSAAVTVTRELLSQGDGPR